MQVRGDDDVDVVDRQAHLGEGMIEVLRTISP
jgi:hypothetical protein